MRISSPMQKNSGSRSARSRAKTSRSSCAASTARRRLSRKGLRVSSNSCACRMQLRHLRSDRFFTRTAAMQTRDGIVEAIGNTPLIKLERASAATGCTILGKAEFMNPGQSVKDRPARQMILEAEKRGEIKPGGLVVESTAGNTGIGLALVANARGYRTLIVIPETQSQEKKDMLRLCGADLVEVPAVT